MDTLKVSSSPMFKQYHSIKAEHKDCILFFRLGDFYEMFYDDAKTAARILDLVLTSRGKKPSDKVPMCGFPHHAADNYIAKLIQTGHKVAICEQMEDPADAKGIVKRDVTRVITSGTYLDEQSTNSRYLISLAPNGKDIGIAFIDPTTGTIFANQYPNHPKTIITLIENLSIFECIFPQSHEEELDGILHHPFLKAKPVTLSPFDDWSFNLDISKKALCEHFAVANLHGFGIEELPAATSSCGALLEYLRQMNKQPLKHIDRIALYTDSDYVYISPAAHRGLELNTLIKTLDETLTALGKRKFTHWFTHPLKNSEDIIKRQKAISVLKEARSVQDQLCQLLKKVPDLEKNISRISCGYTHAKDLLAIRNTLALLPQIDQLIQPLSKEHAVFSIEDIPTLREYLQNAINEDIPLSHPEGKVIARGLNAELDELRDIQENGRLWLKKLQEEEIKRTGIQSLKIGFNKVFGYYIEITKTNLNNVPNEYIRRQTLVNAERYITPELKEYEDKILNAQEKVFKIEQELIKEICAEILKHSLELHNFCDRVATFDVLYALCVLADSPHYTLPEISNDTTLSISEGRHPVVEKTTIKDFVANDTLLDCEGNHLMILTGPNMSGKSTYIRQTALLTIMAQVGSYIPAQSAHIGIVDKIFTRIGAHDDIAKGQSTFMVEMNETADILNNLTDRSLIIFDEIGRGTSTYDGLSLAWAIAEYVHQTKVRTLFATHFHELTALAHQYDGVVNYNVAVKEWKEEIVFLHKIIPGGTDDSYGIYVAKLAGIHQDVIDRAKHILNQLELKNDLKEQLKTTFDKQLDFFAQGAVSSETSCEESIAMEIKETLEALDVNSLTPLEALNKVQELKAIIENQS